MDRRQRKTRESIFNAFIFLLSKKHYDKITVGEIIEIADVGRATFYSHFETKDFLLKELCGELFNHLFHQQQSGVKNIFDCDIKDDVFLHLFKHIQKNDNNICKLLSCKNNSLFLEYFKTEIRLLITKRLADFSDKKPLNIPDDFWLNHLTSTFIETLLFWIKNQMKQTPETITQYFLALI
jgi:AcrR family transcriptional regulator